MTQNHDRETFGDWGVSQDPGGDLRGAKAKIERKEEKRRMAKIGKKIREIHEGLYINPDGTFNPYKR